MAFGLVPQEIEIVGGPPRWSADTMGVVACCGPMVRLHRAERCHFCLSILRIDKVAALERDFTSFVNLLLDVQSSAEGLVGEALSTTSREETPDGGVDAAPPLAMLPGPRAGGAPPRPFVPP